MNVTVYNDPAWPWWRKALRSSSLSMELQGAIALLRLLANVLIVAVLTVLVVLLVQRIAQNSVPQDIVVYYEETPD